MKNQHLKAALRAKPFAVASAIALALAANPALAQDASEEGDVGEIIVTAQKRAQSLSDVSLSVSAVGAETLANSNTAGLEGLQNLVPSVTFGNDFNFAKLFIRGIGLSSSLPGVDPSVALHVDGAVVSLAQAQLGSLFDLERVEVLRGPQGTLYGRNATGGAVNLITAKPTADTKGYVRLTVGGKDLNIVAEAAVGGPITDKIRGRVAFRAVKRDGYGINEFTGSEIDNANQFSTRAHLEFLPSDKVNVLLTGEYHEEKDRSLAIKFRSLSFPGVLTDNIATNDGLSALGQRLNADGSAAAFARNPRNLNTNFDPINDRQQYALTGAVSIEASDSITLKSLTSYRKFDAIFFHDFDASTYLGFPLAQTSATRSSANHFQPIFQNQFTQEFQANVDTDKFNGVFGLFYLKENVEALNHIGFDVLTNSDPFRVQFDGKLDVKTFAAFANATFELSDQLSIKGGARYSHEKRFLANNRGIGTAAGFVRDALQFNEGRTFNNFSPSLGLEFRPNDDLLLYGNWSRGFKSGTAEIGSGLRTATSPSPFVEPEKVEAFEVGAKYSGSSLKVNLAGFFQRLKNGQFSLTRPIPAPPFFTSTLTNAAVSEGYGADLEILWRPVDAFTLNATVAYLHSEFTEFTASDPLDGRLFAPGAVASQLVRDLSGNATRNSPKWSVNLNPTYDIATGNGGKVQLGSNFAYRSRQFHTEFNDARLGQKGYIQLDANIQYKSPSERVTANLWVKNITDEFVYSGSFAISTSRIIGGTLQPPRTYGITLGYKY